MVVFQYGSAVLFNIEDHEVESFLDLIRRHASGLLPEIKKDGNFFLPTQIIYYVCCDLANQAPPFKPL